jgi:hypothetical protein
VLRALAEWNPISPLVEAMRELWGNTTPLSLKVFRNRTMK